MARLLVITVAAGSAVTESLLVLYNLGVARHRLTDGEEGLKVGLFHR